MREGEKWQLLSYAVKLWEICYQGEDYGGCEMGLS